MSYSLHLGKYDYILGNLQRIRLLQTIVSLLFIATLGIVFLHNSFELTQPSDAIKDWIKGIKINSILYITASIVGIFYLFVRNTLMIPSVLAIVLPILGIISPAFRHPAFFLMELNLISLVVFPLFYYKYKDLGWIIEINRYVLTLFLLWISCLGLSNLLEITTIDHVLLPNLNMSSMLVYTITLFSFPMLLIGNILMLFNKTHRIGNIMSFIGVSLWLISRFLDGAYFELIPLSFIFIQQVVLMAGMENALSRQSECLRNGIFKLLILTAGVLPLAGFSSTLNQLLNDELAKKDEIYSSKQQAFHEHIDSNSKGI